jgi:methylenetetrahydrofolate reductase (NADPH)
MSFQRPIGDSIELIKRLAAAGYQVTAHLSARQFTSVEEAEETIAELRRRGIDRVVVVGGDASGDGPFPNAVKLLSYLRDRGNPFAEVGIAGHPEGHPQVPADEMMEALIDKAALSTTIVTQLCFEPEAIGAWVAQVRLNHLDLPVEVSIPGAVESDRLVRTLDLIGVGDSRKLVRGSKDPYDPTELVAGIARLPIDEHGIAGLHFATFNEIDATETWRQRLYDAARNGGGG